MKKQRVSTVKIAIVVAIVAAVFGPSVAFKVADAVSTVSSLLSTSP